MSVPDFVAQRRSPRIDAAQGSYHGSPPRCSLASEAIDRAIFTLPVGRLSERLEHSNGFHVERTAAGTRAIRAGARREQRNTA